MIVPFPNVLYSGEFLRGGNIFAAMILDMKII